MDAAAIAALAGVAWGFALVVTRMAIARTGADPTVGALVAIVTALLTATIAAGVATLFGAIDWDTVEGRQLWPFVLAGAIAPGISHVLLYQALRDVGASRAGIMVGAAPLVSAVLAVFVLDEDPAVALGVATVLIVVGSALIAWDGTRGRAHLWGTLMGLASAVAFAVRDVVARGASDDAPPPLVATVVALAAGSLVLLACATVLAGGARSLVPRLRVAVPAFVLPGLITGVAYTVLLVAFERGPVTVVSPLNATQSLWAVVFGGVLIGRTEVSARITVAALMIVAGGALVGVNR